MTYTIERNWLPACNFEVGDTVNLKIYPAPKWWRRIETWRRVFGFKPRTWRKRYRILSVTATSLEVEPKCLDIAQAKVEPND